MWLKRGCRKMIDLNNVKILVCCHKDSPLPKDDLLLPIQVGAKISNVSLNIQRDDQINGNEVENISDKNQGFCELTALYWAWKNIKKIYPNLEYIGLNHYRRYFAFDEVRSTGSAIQRHVDTISDYKVDKCKLEKILSSGKIVTNPKAKLKCSVGASYEHAHNSTDLRILHDVVKELYPEYLDAFNEFYIRTNYFYDCNMFIMPFSEFGQYCEWLFSILFETERRVNTLGYDAYQRRVFGFMAEHLFTLWILKRKLRIQPLNYIMYSESPRPYKKGLKALLGYKKSMFKLDLGFRISKPYNKNLLEKYWIVP